MLATDNGTRPAGTALWQNGDLDGLLGLMKEVVENRLRMVAKIPIVALEDNTRRLADSVERQVGLTTKRYGNSLTQVSSEPL